mmetsp:Transcript_24481/g.52986  ORF Transcript_24481/g.52986 Transcript_24481/m.52986 type:complete len:131 (+) Transcript_24481:185-577(+)
MHTLLICSSIAHSNADISISARHRQPGFIQKCCTCRQMVRQLTAPGSQRQALAASRMTEVSTRDDTTNAVAEPSKPTSANGRGGWLSPLAITSPCSPHPSPVSHPSHVHLFSCPPLTSLPPLFPRPPPPR